MKFEIHYKIKDYNDYFVINGDSLKEIKELADKEISKRGLDIFKNNIYSIQI